jgi:hypothetical protein
MKSEGGGQMRNRGTLIFTGLGVLIVLLIGTVHDLTIGKSMTHWELGFGDERDWWGVTLFLLALLIGGIILLLAVRIRTARIRTSTSEPLHPSGNANPGDVGHMNDSFVRIGSSASDRRTGTRSADSREHAESTFSQEFSDKRLHP